MRTNRHHLTGAGLVLLGLLLAFLAALVHEHLAKWAPVAGPLVPEVTFGLVITALAAAYAGCVPLAGQPVSLRIHEWQIPSLSPTEPDRPTPKPSPRGLARRKAYSRQKQLPGGNAPALNLLAD